jgi:hypothetical protein
MSSTVLSHADLLRALHRASPTMRKSIIKAADCGLVKSICECADNTLKGRVQLNMSQKRKLARHKKLLRKLVLRGENWKRKKKILQQKGGALLPLLIAPILSSILGSIFKS